MERSITGVINSLQQNGSPKCPEDRLIRKSEIEGLSLAVNNKDTLAVSHTKQEYQREFFDLSSRQKFFCCDVLQWKIWWSKKTPKQHRAAASAKMIFDPKVPDIPTNWIYIRGCVRSCEVWSGVVLGHSSSSNTTAAESGMFFSSTRSSIVLPTAHRILSPGGELVVDNVVHGLEERRISGGNQAPDQLSSSFCFHWSWTIVGVERTLTYGGFHAKGNGRIIVCYLGG